MGKLSGVNLADGIAVVVVILTAVSGLRRGLVTGVTSLSGLIVGTMVGVRVAPDLVGGASGAYVPLIALAGAALGGMVGQSFGVLVGRYAHQVIDALPPLRMLDSAGGVALGAVTGLAICWAVGAVLLYVPGQTELRRLAQESVVVSALTDAVPPSRVMQAVGRIDPFSAIVGPESGVDPPDPLVVADPEVREAARSVVRITGYACGLGVEGSGWIVGPGLVVTNAHVVAGVNSPVVDRRDGNEISGRVVAFDTRNDVAVLRVPGLRGRALALVEPERGQPAALLGFPENGPLQSTPVRIGRSGRVNARDAYGRLELGRPVVALRGDVRSGNSGGPIVSSDGLVLATVFAQRSGSGDGFAVPNDRVHDALENVGPALETSCVAR
jgi:S1-C subfamily serine protease